MQSVLCLDARLAARLAAKKVGNTVQSKIFLNIGLVVTLQLNASSQHILAYLPLRLRVFQFPISKKG